MAFGLEAAHVDADLRDHHLGRQRTDAGDGGQHFDGYAKGFDVGTHLLIDRGDGFIHSIEMVQMQPQHEAMMGRHPSAQRRLQFIGGGVDAPVSQGRQSLGIGLSGDQRLNHAAAGEAKDVGEHRIELDVGIFQRLLQALRVAAAFAHELLAGAQQIPHLLGRLVGHEAGPDQPMRHQIGQPGGVVHVRLAPRHVLDMGGVGQHQFELAIGENMPDRLPVDARGLHAAMCVQPSAQSQSDSATSSWVVALNVLTPVVTLPSSM